MNVNTQRKVKTMALASDFLALSANPAMGDGMGQYLWIVVVALVASLVLIIVIAALSGKKNRKNRRK